ncbi:BtrH N-terminal domain-containing protein [Acrocarpospora catenulata]|uniref:BtrH N-terminal domain-containing protein n=1 Tax=Acrocarpospora catenulata TaxID=2836182 RepID=UPI001BDA8EE3|nr:BtrH N-terminal domain-containing protein [Acrocarpospora catenulata]
MTGKKQLKTRIRARMAKTGESYTTARMHLVGAEPAPAHDGWTLHGGRHPGSSVITNILRNGGVEISEPLVFLAGGGIGAGYILWEWKHNDSRSVTLGFRNQWQYPRQWLEKTLTRLAVPFDVHTTGGARGAAERLTAELDAGRPCVILPDRYHIGYWHFPPHLDGYGGHPVIAYRRDATGVYLDDRNLAPLHVLQERVDAARARVGSYKNMLHVPHPRPVPLAEAVLAGLRDCAAHLSAASDSFSLPAWRKWSRTLVDPKAAKSWPKVFPDGRGLAGALRSVWEGVEPVGMEGGNLRDLFADGLDEAAKVTGLPLSDLAAEFRRIHGLWHEFAEAALPAAEFGRLRELTAEIRSDLVAEGASDPAAAEELWALRGAADQTDPARLAELSDLLAAIHQAETEAIAELGRLTA